MQIFPYPDGSGKYLCEDCSNIGIHGVDSKLVLSDSPLHCSAGYTCQKAIILPNGQKIGRFLENTLTLEGIQKLQDKINAVAVITMWADFYEMPRWYEVINEKVQPMVVFSNK